MRRFENKVAIVTGGANGLGEAIVRRFVQEGGKVAVVDIAEDRIKEVCNSMPEDTIGICIDVSDKVQVDSMVEKVIEKYGRIDILFNNAGQCLYAPFLEMKEELWDKVFAVNAKGYYFVGQVVAKTMVEKNIEGIIVNTASVACNIVTATTSAYAASKGAVMQLTKVMALELAPYGIRVNCIGPGAMLTNMTAQTRKNPAKVESFVNQFTVKRFADPAEVAGVALFLASDDASYVSGSIYYVDGGWSIG